MNCYVKLKRLKKTDYFNKIYSKSTKNQNFMDEAIKNHFQMTSQDCDLKVDDQIRKKSKFVS